MHSEQPYALTINQNQVLEVTPSEARNLDIIEDGKDNFHILYNGKAYKAILEAENEEGNVYSIRVNGTRFEVAVADKYERLGKTDGLDSRRHSKTQQREGTDARASARDHGKSRR